MRPAVVTHFKKPLTSSVPRSTVPPSGTLTIDVTHCVSTIDGMQRMSTTHRISDWGTACRSP